MALIKNRFILWSKAWLLASRPKTLPLALSSICIGSGLAAIDNHFSLDIFTWAVITALLLQLLSNLANDLGDAVSGADNSARLGPTRAVQAGLISKSAMLKAIYVIALLALFSGCWLIWLAFNDDIALLLLFAALGFTAIAAALRYTLGSSPYGYRALGDLAVFIFFGLVAVLGSYFLFNHHITLWLLLPAISSGLLAASVLNINNIRDEHSDRLSGKLTLVVKMGGAAARQYHVALITLAILCSQLYLAVELPTRFGWLALFIVPWLLKITRTVVTSHQPQQLNTSLKLTAMAALFYNLLFAIGIQFGF